MNDEKAANCSWKRTADESANAAAKRVGSKHEEIIVGVNASIAGANVYCQTCGWLFAQNADPEWHPEVFW